MVGSPKGGAQNFALFFPLPHQISFFLPSLGSSGSPNAHNGLGHGLEPQLQFHDKTPEREKHYEICGGRGEKKERNFGRSRGGGPASGGVLRVKPNSMDRTNPPVV